MEITNQQHEAAGEIVELIATELGENRAIHPGTVIISCGRISGSFMFRSFNFQMKNIYPGNAVLSENANEKGPILINVLVWMLNNLAINIDNEKAQNIPMAESNLNFLDTLGLLQGKAIAIMNKHKLNYEQMAYSCAMATAFIIKECQRDLSIESAFNSAIYSFIEGSKTCPPELSSPAPKKKGIFSFWK